jgi:hypothetical protein
MHLRGNVIYNTWENFWKKAYKSSYFRAQYDETSERTDWSLSERQLFTQSNGRTVSRNSPHNSSTRPAHPRIPWADCTFCALLMIKFMQYHPEEQIWEDSLKDT